MPVRFIIIKVIVNMGHYVDCPDVRTFPDASCVLPIG